MDPGSGTTGMQESCLFLIYTCSAFRMGWRFGHGAALEDFTIIIRSFGKELQRVRGHGPWRRIWKRMCICLFNRDIYINYPSQLDTAG
ncbi:hypothetical protein HETIRDRAFT_233995, partial [Heterobasidion irregulare TC 32-1]